MRATALLRALPRLTLYTGGPECSLCEVAKEALMELKQKRGLQFELETLNIREKGMDPSLKKWRRLYQYDIPVLHLNGEQVMKHRVNPDKLEALIRKAGEQQ
ncbi:glutaredoxin 2 [Cystobasidium minutum MCA 4210]|uniref:glutaredoxin 2 n=1 Tax=Cystobasidium minutum MCA 4210 TaxID=1397322 RepID=UPI0034CF51D5|eukprot:jgi/Rhomi1/101551/CE101550_406